MFYNLGPSSEKYELHSYRRNMVIKLQQYLNEDLVSTPY
jgi:hypothetical protein